LFDKENVAAKQLNVFYYTPYSLTLFNDVFGKAEPKTTQTHETYN